MKRLPLVAFLAVTAPAVLAASVIDFEGLADGTILANQYPGVTFADATVITAGISLNEFDFPRYPVEVKSPWDAELWSILRCILLRQLQAGTDCYCSIRDSTIYSANNFNRRTNDNHG